jgi:hypothetical protein
MTFPKVCVLNKLSRNEINSCHTRSIAATHDKSGHAAMKI